MILNSFQQKCIRHKNSAVDQNIESFKTKIPTKILRKQYPIRRVLTLASAFAFSVSDYIFMPSPRPPFSLYIWHCTCIPTWVTNYFLAFISWKIETRVGWVRRSEGIVGKYLCSHWTTLVQCCGESHLIPPSPPGSAQCVRPKNNLK